jgi:hypothetical protein
MATLNIGASVNSFMGYGQTVTITTSHNVSGRWYFVSQNPEIPGLMGLGRSFGPGAYSEVVGPFAYPGTLYIENYAGSAGVITYTINDGTAYPGNFTSLAATSYAQTAGTFSATGTGAKTLTSTSTGTVTVGATGTGTTTITRVNSLTVVSTDSSGTPGNATNNNLSGRAAFAAAGTSVVITNSLVTAASKIFVQVNGNDATLKSATVTAAAGSFTVTGNAAATATTVFDFLVVN